MYVGCWASKATCVEESPTSVEESPASVEQHRTKKRKGKKRKKSKVKDNKEKNITYIQTVCMLNANYIFFYFWMRKVQGEEVFS